VSALGGVRKINLYGSGVTDFSAVPHATYDAECTTDSDSECPPENA